MRLSLGKICGICFLGSILLAGASTLTSQTSAPPSTTPPPANASSATAGTSSTTPSDPFPDGPGKDIFLRTCNTICHTPDRVLGYRLDAAGWGDILDRMIANGAQGSQEDFNAIYTYLTTNFGPETAAVSASQTAPPANQTPPASGNSTPPAAQSQAAPAPAQPADEWPDGPGKAIFLQTCSVCHTPENVLGHNLDSDGWTDILQRMVQFGAQGSDDDFTAILNYLVTNFPPAPAKVNINKATAMNLRNWLGMPQASAEAIVAYRTQHGDFKTLDDVKAVPGVDTKFLDSVKDSLTFS
jgi:competence protein ComEA